MRGWVERDYGDNSEGIILPNASPNIEVELATIRETDLPRKDACVTGVDHVVRKELVGLFSGLESAEKGFGCGCVWVLLRG